MLQRGCINTDDGACSLIVCAMETIQVPPSSEMEIMAPVQGQPCIGPQSSATGGSMEWKTPCCHCKGPC